MVESQQERDSEQDYTDNNDNDVNTFIRSEYLDNCDLYNINDHDIDSNSNNSNPLESSVNSTYSRPVST